MMKFKEFIALRETDCPQDEYGKLIAAHDIKPIKPIEPKKLRDITSKKGNQMPLKPKNKITFREFNKLYDAGMALKLSEQEYCNALTRTLQKIKPLKPLIKIGVNRTKITDSRTGYARPATTKENVNMSSQSIVEMLSRKAAATAERKRREDSDTNRFINGSAVDDYNAKRAIASAMATAAVKKTLEAVSEEGSWARPSDTLASATLRNKPNVEKSKAADTIKQHVITINLDLPRPEQLGFGHSPTQKPAVQQRTPNYRYPGVKTGAPAPGEKQQFPKKPKGDMGSNIESGRGYY